MLLLRCRVGGCDGTEPERRYFTQVADATPDDTMILTLGRSRGHLGGARWKLLDCVCCGYQEVTSLADS